MLGAFLIPVILIGVGLLLFFLGIYLLSKKGSEEHYLWGNAKIDNLIFSFGVLFIIIGVILAFLIFIF